MIVLSVEPGYKMRLLSDIDLSGKYLGLKNIIALVIDKERRFKN